MMAADYYKFEITCQKHRRKILPTPFAALKTVSNSTPYIHACDTIGNRKSSTPQKPTSEARTYDTLSVDLSNDPHFAEDA